MTERMNVAIVFVIRVRLTLYKRAQNIGTPENWDQIGKCQGQIYSVEKTCIMTNNVWNSVYDIY